MKFLCCLSLLLLIPLVSAAYADCPKCYKDQQPLTALHGHSADGRVKILVGISVGGGPDSWAHPPGTTIAQQKLAEAAGQGMGMWNGAIDDDGNKTNFFFDTIRGTQPASSVDIVIVKSPMRDSDGEPNPVAEMETGGRRPYKLFVREDMVDSMSASDLAGLFAHELGHRIGLENTDCAGTIMQRADPQADGTIKMRQATVGARDVHMSRVNSDPNLRPTCTELAPKRNYLDTDGAAGGACLDGDGDGMTTCGHDCNDEDPSLTLNCGSTLNCNPEAAGECSCTADQLSYKEWCWVEGMVWIPEFCACGNTPILIDTSGDGFDLTDARRGVAFDLNGDGKKDTVAWTAAGSDDAWLALDRNGNGRVDDGQELFGDRTQQPPSDTPNGFRALAEFDQPARGGLPDGGIDSRDAVFADLRLWLDADHDGISEPGELHTLVSLDIERIELDYKESKKRDEHGNWFRYRAKVDDAKGAKVGRWAWDVFLVAAP